MRLGPGDALVALIASCQLRRGEPLFWARLHFPDRLRRQAAVARLFFRELPPDAGLSFSEPDYGL
jgi:hypothetical protein